MNNWLYLLLTHRPSSIVDRQIAYLTESWPEVSVVVCYGGSIAEFQKIRHEQKLFLQDVTLRGPVQDQEFTEIYVSAYNEFVVSRPTVQFVYLAEFDHLPLQSDSFEQLNQAMIEAGADFAGKNCIDRAGTNWPHRFRYPTDCDFVRFLSEVSVRDVKSTIFGALGNGFVIRREALTAFASISHFRGVYTEVYIPTILWHLGFRPLDLAAVGSLYRLVRHSPVFSVQEVISARDSAVPFLHPIKDDAVFDALQTHSRSKDE
jgi:hypothetical protein